MQLPIVLASASPRRHRLLGQILDSFEVVIADLDEDAMTVPDPWETALLLAEAKARAVLAMRPEALVIGGDTVVAVDSDGRYMQLAKPTDEADARSMLARLSGRQHVVITGVCLAQEGRVQTFSETTYVTFRDLSPAEIADYVASGDPMGKAGAYAIQGGASGFVESVEGSVTNVVGLPVERLRVELLPFIGPQAT